MLFSPTTPRARAIRTSARSASSTCAKVALAAISCSISVSSRMIVSTGRPTTWLSSIELVAVGATEAGIDQQRAEVAGVEQPARVFFRRSGGAQLQQRLLARRAAEQRRHIAQHTHVEDRVPDMRRHARVGRLGEEAPEAIADQRRARPQQRVAVMIEDRDSGDIMVWLLIEPRVRAIIDQLNADKRI